MIREESSSKVTFDASSKSDQALPAEKRLRFGLLRKGVSIVRFSPDSVAENAGMQKGDVIIEYDSVGNLTIEKLPALATKPRPAETAIPVAFLRHGGKHSLMLPPGPLGISAINVSRQGRSKKRQAGPVQSSSNEKLVQFIKSELAERTSKVTLRRTLVRDGWDKKEAALFVDHIADQLAADPDYDRTAQGRFKIAVVLLLLLGILSVVIDFFSGARDAFTANWRFLVYFACLLGMWLVWRRRVKSLRPKKQEIERRISSFAPTRGDLQVTKLYRSWKDLPSYMLHNPLRVYLIVVGIIFLVFLVMALVIFAIDTFYTFGHR